MAIILSEEFMENTVAQFIQSFKVMHDGEDIQNYLLTHDDCTINIGDYFNYK